ncbi:hypothetical protein D3C87_16820 [compost metagenome]
MVDIILSFFLKLNWRVRNRKSGKLTKTGLFTSFDELTKFQEGDKRCVQGFKML